ncbi:MFS transporter [Loktanella sp. IMCC34160]|uniref:MFS transporter n=1 Tax=Loktanella sp. IMCC34160 TaxID=2510646 RepID=UPI00101C0671|nr:MFS transporter [Loktanella sp. IMCC34160]RYG89732.1 MFS transporter [Loktanella sp. IMCC34160]
MIRILRHPVFAHLFAAQVVALLGTGLLTVALGLLAYDLAGDRAGLVLGTAYTIKMVAYVGLAPLSAAILSRVPRKPLLIGADLIRAGVALSLPFVSDIWQIYLCIFLLQTASATFTPAFQSTIPEVLTDEADYTRALSLSRLAYDIENLVSPALAGALLLIVSYSNLFLGTVAGFILSALLIWRVALPLLPRAKDAPFRERLLGGLARYLATPRLRGLLALTLTAAAASAFVIVNTVVMVRGSYGRDEGAVALALAAYGAGSMLAALVLPRLLDHRPDRPVMLAGGVGLVALMGLAAAGFAGGPPGWGVLLGLWFGMGLAYSAVLTPSGRLLRRSAPPEARPPLFTAQFALSHACWLLTYPLAGWAMTALGPAGAFAALALPGALGVGLALWLWPMGD